MNPTDEQVKAVELFKEGKRLAIEAGAGTGKTATLIYIAQSTKKSGQYIAFNRAIVDEATKKMPNNIVCNTAHSLAYRALGYKFKDRLNQPRIPSHITAKLLGLEPFYVKDANQDKRFSPEWLAGHVLKSVSRFCNSTDSQPSLKHVPRIESIDFPDITGKRNYTWNNKLAKHILPAVEVAWKDFQKQDGQLRFSPDHYLKIWQLNKPKIHANFILFDEAQDASPVMLDIINQQSCQVVWVGDTNQQLYEWRGAINALSLVEVELKSYLTHSFRFGQNIADLANKTLEKLNSPIQLIGTNQASEIKVKPEELKDPDAILTRTNAGSFYNFLQYIGDDKKPHLIG